MKKTIAKDIEILQDSLPIIRRAGGWTAEEFGSMIGVTKQTISNLENKKTPMNKTQYIAIRTILDYEMAERRDDTSFATIVNLCLNTDGLGADNLKKVQTYVAGATKTGLDAVAIVSGIVSLVGETAIDVTSTLKPAVTGAGDWLRKILK